MLIKLEDAPEFLLYSHIFPCLAAGLLAGDEGDMLIELAQLLASAFLASRVIPGL